MPFGVSSFYTSEPSRIPRIAYGSYTGDGNPTKTITIPFQADKIWIDCEDTGSAIITAWANRTGTKTLLLTQISGAVGYSTTATGIIAFGANSFTVKSDDGLNVLNAVYYYIAQQAGN